MNDKAVLGTLEWSRDLLTQREAKAKDPVEKECWMEARMGLDRAVRSVNRLLNRHNDEKARALATDLAADQGLF